jgi:hypothetical protein
MGEFFVLKVTIIYRKGSSACYYTKHPFAGPFDTKEEAQAVAASENDVKKRRKEKHWMFQVGSREEIGATGVIL